MTAITHPQQSEVKEEITFPLFLVDGINYYKLTRVPGAIRIVDLDGHASIGEVPVNSISERADVCPEVEFDFVYKKVSQILEDRAK